MDLKEAILHKSPPSRHPWETARLRVVTQLIRPALTSDSGVVWDIGCGDAFVSGTLALRNPHLTFHAIDTAFADDLTDDTHPSLPQNLNLWPSLDNASEASPSPDLIILLDVLEHIDDETAFLHNLAERIGQDTTVLITVPAWPSFFGPHDRWLGHCRRYTSATLRSSIACTDWQIQTQGYFFFSLAIIRAFQSLAQRLGFADNNNVHQGVAGWNGSPRLSALIESILVADASLCLTAARTGLPAVGLSCFALCQT